MGDGAQVYAATDKALNSIAQPPPMVEEAMAVRVVLVAR